jgi:putative tricarboxylic transport membrane protein
MSEQSPSTSSRPAARRGLVRAPQELAAGATLLGLALFALWAGADLDQGTLRAMGPGLLPRAIAVLIAAVGAALIVLSFLTDGERLERVPLRGPLFVCLGIVAFALTVRTVGLLVAGPLVALVSAAASPETRLKELLVFTVVITAFCIALFKYALNLPIPVLIIPGVVVI